MALTWLTAFAWTLALELPVYTVLLGRHFRRWWAVVVLALVVNGLTHPMLWFVFPRLEPYWLYLLAGEITVTLIEAIVIAAVIRRPLPALAASFAANLTSFLGGIVMWSLLL